jgi:hypothetical protein
MANYQRPWLRIRYAASALLALALLTALGSSSPAQTPRTPACIQSWAETRYRDYGYDHIVHIANTCQARAVCFVSSNLNPTPLKVDVPVAQQIEVLAARSSTPRDFTPQLACGLIL